jgi:ribosomal protein S18 acetylase RimI-like enzyme
MPYRIVRVDPDAWPGLAGLIFALNRRPGGGVHCLHASQGDDVASHEAELAALDPNEAAFWTVMDGDRRIGVVGCAVAPALGRAWMRGPLLAEPHALPPLLDRLVAAVEAALPGIHTFDAFPSADSAALNDWYAAAGYELQAVHRVLRAPIGATAGLPPTVRRARGDDVPAVAKLHVDLFETPYLLEEDLRQAVDATDRALFVADDDGGRPVAYLHVKDEAGEQEAYVDYLGVEPDHRGRGIARALLDAAAHWGAGQGRAHVALTVREDRQTAMNLYFRAGFAEISAGRHWRKVLGAAPSR